MKTTFIYRLVIIITLTTYSFINTWHCEITSLAEILPQNPQISYIPCKEQFPFLYKPLPFANDHYLHPFSGIFKPTFILTIPQGHVFGLDGWVLINDCLISELIWQNVFLSSDMLNAARNNPIIEKKGRVAVITQTGFSYYYHWITEVLGRLALLEMKGIEYDFLYVPNTAPYMLETLLLWGIDPSKIIVASDNHIIKADELIVPSLISSVSVNGCPRLVHYIPTYIVEYIRNKLLTSAMRHQNNYNFDKRIFISRQDAAFRKILNEDEVFDLLQLHGFKRFYLTQLSILEQILLFYNAEIIVGSLGSGLTNVLFCNTQTKIIELYQARRDCTIWNLSQMAGIKDHHCIKTTEFIDAREGQYDTAIPLEIIQQVIKELIIPQKTV